MPAGLDVLTPRGQETVAQEQRAAAIFQSRLTEFVYVSTPKDGPASVDAVLLKGTNLAGVVETKCRVMTRQQLTGYGDEWLVTWDKIDRARAIAAGLGVPLFGFLYLVPDDMLLVVRISDKTGALLVPVRVAATETRATVNGGSAVRNNAYISITTALEIPGGAP